MKRLTRREALKMLVTTAGLTTVTPLVGESAEPENHEVEGSDNMNLKIPGSLKDEHEELHEELVRATRAGGKTGEAAQAVAKVLHTSSRKNNWRCRRLGSSELLRQA